MVERADKDLVAAAQFERDRRDALAPKAVADASAALEPDRAKIDEIIIDCQCWTAIAEWIETGHFAGFYGGADPHADHAPWISWPEVEDAAAAAVRKVSAKLDALEAKAGAMNVAPEELGALRLRRHHLAVIHRKVMLRRQMIDSINAEYRKSRAAPPSDGLPPRAAEQQAA